MPTRKEVAKIKADYVDKRNSAITTSIREIQQGMYDKVLADFLAAAKQQDPKLRVSQKYINTMAGEIKKEFDKQFPLVMQELVSSSRGVLDLNLMYYSTMLDTNRLAEIRDKTIKNTNRALGVDAAGKVIKGGFLDKSLSSKAVMQSFSEQVKSLVAMNVDTVTAQNKLRELVTGTRKQTGLLERYYNTFAKDVIINVSRTSSAVFANELGLKHAFYEGGLIKTSRSFCLQKNGKIFPLETIMKWKDSKFIQDMYGDKIDEYDPINGPPGGYGCLHSMSWITEELAKGVTKENNAAAAAKNKGFADRNGL